MPISMFNTKAMFSMFLHNRSRAAKIKVDQAKPIQVQSKKQRKKIKREILNGNATFKKLDEDNNRIVDQINIDVSDLERKLKELNR